MASLSKNASAQARTYARKHTQADGQIENIIPQWPIIWEVAYFWHAPLGVHSAIRRHQPPHRTVLGQVDSFVQCEVVDLLCDTL